MKLIPICLVTLVLLFIPGFVNAQVENPLVPTKTPYQQVKEKQKNIVRDIFERLFGENQNAIPIPTSTTQPTTVPITSISPGANTPSLPITPIPPPSNGKYIMFRQGDYTDIPLPDGCDIAYAGCGPTAVTNVVVNLKDAAATPERIVKDRYGSEKFRTAKWGEYRYASCKGTTYIGAQEALKEEGFTTEIAYAGDPVSIDSIADELIPFLRNGAWIVAGANFSGGGHFFVIIDIVPNGDSYDIIGLDSAYGNRNTIPINYRYMYPYPYIKSAVAAKL